MTDRQKKIIKLLIREYINRPKPVSSKLLAQKYKLGLSSATIRSEMKELEKLGYLSQPHTSAGRIPTEKAYRLFIEFSEEKEKKKTAKKTISNKPSEKPGLKQSEETLREMTKKLAQMSGGFAFSGIEEEDFFHQFGLANLLKEAELEDEDFFAEITQIMEELDKHFDKLFKKAIKNETQVFIGKENPLGKTKKLTLIISSCKTPKQKQGVIGLLGPIRMRYDYNIPLINKLKEMLEEYE
ncbi:MAG: hypothetical protein ACOC5T_04745 [Elusimicrobiota bacterium]